jgi:hypothetical protein
MRPRAAARIATARSFSFGGDTASPAITNNQPETKWAQPRAGGALSKGGKTMRQLLRKVFLTIFAVLLLCSLLGMYTCYHYLAPPGNNEQTAQRNADAAPEGNSAGTTNGPSYHALGEYEEPLLPVLTVLCAPGLFVLGKIGIVPASTPVWVIAGGISWPSWAVSLRLAWIVPARYFGFGYSPESYHWWQWIGPPWRPAYKLLDPTIH